MTDIIGSKKKRGNVSAADIVKPTPAQSLSIEIQLLNARFGINITDEKVEDDCFNEIYVLMRDAQSSMDTFSSDKLRQLSLLKRQLSLSKRLPHESAVTTEYKARYNLLSPSEKENDTPSKVCLRIKEVLKEARRDRKAWQK